MDFSRPAKNNYMHRHRVDRILESSHSRMFWFFNRLVERTVHNGYPDLSSMHDSYEKVVTIESASCVFRAPESGC